MFDLSTSTRFRLFVVALLAIYVTTYLHQFIVAEAVYPITKYFRAGDLGPFLLAANQIRNGGPLYENYNKPPLFAVFLSSLNEISFPLTITVYQVLTILLTVSTVIVLCRQVRQGFWVSVACLLATCCSWSFAFLVDRGNVDGFSMGLSALSTIALASGLPFLAVLLFAIGVNMKTNVLPLAAALLIAPTWNKSLQRGVLAFIAIVCLAALTPRWTVEFLQIAVRRASMEYKTVENVSIFPLFAGLPNGKQLAMYCIIGFGLSIVAGLWFSTRKNKATNAPIALLLLLPLCYAYPSLSHPYSNILAPLLLLIYGHPLPIVGIRGALFKLSAYIGGAGIIAQCIPILYWRHYVGERTWLDLAPPAGVLMTLGANAVLAWSPLLLQLHKEPQPEAISSRLTNIGSKLILGFIAVVAMYETIAFFVFNSRDVLWFQAATNVSVTEASQSCGSMRHNSTADGKPLMIAGRRFRIGFGTCGNSRIVATVPTNSKSLSGACGVDDSAAGQPIDITCSIKVGGVEKFRSSNMTARKPPESFLIPLDGASQVEFITEGAGNTPSTSQVDWVNVYARP